MENVSIKILLDEVTAESINQLAAPWITAAENANAAAVEYMDNLKQRQFVLATQEQGIRAQLADLNKQQNTLIDKINDLSSCCKFAEAAEEDTRLESVEKEIAALTRKLGSVADGRCVAVLCHVGALSVRSRCGLSEKDRLSVY